MRVYVDFDDILCETAADLSRLALEWFGHTCPYEDIREFDLQVVFSLSDAEMVRFRKLSHDYAILAHYPPTPGAVAGMRALRELGCEVEIATGRPAVSYAGSQAWLEREGLGDFPVFHVDKYGRTADYPTSSKFPRTYTMDEMRARGYAVAIDDSPKALDALAGWRDTRVLVFNRPWNQAYPLGVNMVRLPDWAGIIEEIKRLRR